MSHFLVYVFQNNDDNYVNLLKPFDENIEYEPYVEYTKEEAIEYERKSLEDYEKSWMYRAWLENPKKYEEEHKDKPDHISYIKGYKKMMENITDDELYERMKRWYNEDMITEDGSLMSTDNPKAKWDWYALGGRWDKALIKKYGKHVNEALVSEVNWNKTDVPFAFVTNDGDWHESADMGWFGMTSDDKEEDEWKNEFKSYLKSIKGKDISVSVIDCHI